MKFSKIIILMVVLALFLALGGQQFAFHSDGNSHDILTAKVVRIDMVVEVRTVGELDAADSVVLSSSVRGDRGKIIELVEDGKQVDVGEVLVRLDPSSFEEEVLRLRSKVIELDTMVSAQEQLLQWEKNQVEREINRAESDLDIARLELRRLEKGEGPRELARLKAETRKAKEDYEQKKSYLDSLEKLMEKGFSNPTEQAQIKKLIDDSQQAYKMISMQLSSYSDHLLPVQIEKAKAAIKAAEVALEQTKKGGGFKIGQAMAALEKSEQELESARQSLEIAVKELNATVIKAPSTGMVVLAEQMRGNAYRKPRVGDQVWQNQPLVYLPDVSKMIVNTQVREVDLYKIDVGKPVLTRVDAYPELLLTGRVASIGVMADQGSEGRQKKGKHFKVTIILDQSDPRLRPGMTSRISIVCDQVSGALAIPSFALFREGEKMFAYVALQKGFERREVLPGAKNEDFVEIRAGLIKGELIALSKPEHSEIQTDQLL
jgi:HlyD family secretion protein